jgi:hypothetical protein
MHISRKKIPEIKQCTFQEKIPEIKQCTFQEKIAEIKQNIKKCLKYYSK